MKKKTLEAFLAEHKDDSIEQLFESLIEGGRPVIELDKHAQEVKKEILKNILNWVKDWIKPEGAQKVKKAFKRLNETAQKDLEGSFQEEGKEKDLATTIYLNAIFAEVLHDKQVKKDFLKILKEDQGMLPNILDLMILSMMDYFVEPSSLKSNKNFELGPNGPVKMKTPATSSDISSEEDDAKSFTDSSIDSVNIISEIGGDMKTLQEFLNDHSDSTEGKDQARFWGEGSKVIPGPNGQKVFDAYHENLIEWAENWDDKNDQELIKNILVALKKQAAIDLHRLEIPEGMNVEDLASGYMLALGQKDLDAAIVDNLVKINIDDPNKILKVINAMRSDEGEDKALEDKALIKSFSDARFLDQLHSEIDWTAYKLKKVSGVDLMWVPSVISECGGSSEILNNQYSPVVQKALFNVIAYTGKINKERENPSLVEGSRKYEKINNKYKAATTMIKEIINSGDNIDDMIAAVNKGLKDSNLTKSRGSGFYKIHSFFARKTNDQTQDSADHKHKIIGSTMEELTADLRDTLEDCKKTSEIGKEFTIM